MFSIFQESKVIVIAILLFMLFIMFFVNHRLTKEKNEIQKQLYISNALLETQNHAIEQWKAKQKAQEENIKSFQIKLKKESEKSRNKMESLRATRVPAECDQAIKWGIKEAKEIN